MAQYRYPAIAELTHQLKLSPARLRLKQLDAAEYLVDLIEPDKSYPYDFVCHHITGYRPKLSSQQRGMPGKALIEDLVQLIEDLSAASPLPVGLVPEICLTAEELAARLRSQPRPFAAGGGAAWPAESSATRTKSVRIAFPDRCLRRFVAKHCELVKRGSAFRQLTADEKQRIVTLARETLAERRMRLHELSQSIAARMGRAVETIRYTLRRYDQLHPRTRSLGATSNPWSNPSCRPSTRRCSPDEAWPRSPGSTIAR